MIGDQPVFGDGPLYPIVPCKNRVIFIPSDKGIRLGKLIKKFKTQEIPGVRLGLIQEDSQVIGRTPSVPLLPVAHLGRPSLSDLKSTAP
jgi:hypothetical protein